MGGLSPQCFEQYGFVTSICFNNMGLSPQYSLTKWVCHLNIWEEEKDDWDQLVLKPVMIMMPRIKTMMLVKMVLMMMLMTKTWCWEWCGWSRWCWWHRSIWWWWGQHPTSGRQGPTRWGRTCTRPSAKWTWQKGFAWTWATKKHHNLILTFKSSTFQHLSVGPWCRWCCSKGRRRSAWCSPAPRHPVKITLKGIKHPWKPV